MGKKKKQKKNYKGNVTIDKEKLEKRAKRLYALWWVLMCVYSLSGNVYIALQQVNHGIDVRDFPSTFNLVTCVIAGLVFLPLMTQVRKLAKASHADKLYKKATRWYFVFLIGVAGILLCNTLAYFFPGLFS
jgi:SNF family Na+-dependent transporter